MESNRAIYYSLLGWAMKRFCILGLGRSGWSLAHYLHTISNALTPSQDSGPSVSDTRNNLGHEPGLCPSTHRESEPYQWVVWDDQPEKREAAEGEGWTLWSDDFHWTDAVCVVSPGISHHPIIQKALEHHRPVICDIQLFHHLFPQVKKIGVTGSNGKTTTCALIHHGLVRHNQHCVLAGNMGVPIFSTLHNGLPPADHLYILELSSYQLELCQELSLDVAVILNLFPHHLERHGTMDRYRSLKERILTGARKGWVPQKWPINSLVQDSRQDDSTSPHAPQPISPPFLHRWSQELLEEYTLPDGLNSAHNRDNVSAAVAVLRSLGCNNREVFQDFKGLEHRQELVAHVNQVRYCNDSKATNPHAAAKAIQAYAHSSIVWIAGGVLQHDDLEVLNPFAPHIVHGLMIGQAGQRYAEWLRAHGKSAEICSSLEIAVVKAHTLALSFTQDAESSVTVLLSPGCASFDQFRDFEHRGQVFKQMVQECISSPAPPSPPLVH